MSERILGRIGAGDEVAFEIVEVEGKAYNITLRGADNKEKHIDLPKSVLCVLSFKLREIYIDEYGECDA